MEVTYTLTREDLAAVRRSHARQRAKGRVTSLLSMSVMVGLWILEVMLLVQAASMWRSALSEGLQGWADAIHAHESLLLSFLLLTLFLAHAFWGQKVLLARQSPTASELSKTKHLCIKPEGVHSSTLQEHVAHAWSDILDVQSDADFVYLYQTNLTAFIVPRRAFSSPNQSQNFEAQARAFKANPYPAAARTNADDLAAVWPPPPFFGATGKPSLDPFSNLEDVPGALHLRYVTTRADLLRAQWLFWPHRPLMWLGPMISNVTILGALLSFVLPPGTALFWAAVLAVSFTALALAQFTHQALKRQSAQFVQGRACEIIARPDLLCELTPAAKSICRWTTVSAIQMQRGDVYVLTKHGGGVFVPRRAFADRAAAASFAQQLRGFWQAAKNAPPAPSAQTAGASQTNR